MFIIGNYIKRIRNKSANERAIYTFFWTAFFTGIFIFFQFFTPYIDIDYFISKTIIYNQKDDNQIPDINIYSSQKTSDNSPSPSLSLLDNISFTFKKLKEHFTSTTNISDTKNVSDAENISNIKNIYNSSSLIQNNESSVNNVDNQTNNNVSEKIQNNNESEEVKNIGELGEIKNNNVLNTVYKDSNEDIYLASLKKVSHNIAGVEFVLYIADDDDKRISGLSNTESLCVTCGMLFVFGKERELSFWMKDMNYNIDIIYIDSFGKILNVYENINPDTYPQVFESNGIAKYALEINANMARNIGLKANDVIYLPDVSAQSY